MAKNGITLSTIGLDKLIAGLKRIGDTVQIWLSGGLGSGGSVGERGDVPVDVKKLQKEVRIAARKNLIRAGFRDTPRLQKICNRFTVSSRQTAKTIFVSVQHKSSTDNKVLNNYPGHTVRESLVLNMLLYGRKKKYSIPSQSNNNAKTLKWTKGGITHFHNWRFAGRIQVPTKATFLSNASGNDPYKTKAVIRNRLTSIIEKQFKILRLDINI